MNQYEQQVPKGLGALVVDDRGQKWIRLHSHSPDCNDWYPVQPSDMTGYTGVDSRRSWRNLRVVEILAPGYED